MTPLHRLAALATLVVTGACSGTPPPPAADQRTQAVYNKETGRLAELLSDRDGDGKKETRAFMDGVRFVRIEIDTNGDDKPDRWEYYTPVPAGVTVPTSPDGRVMLERLEEAGNNDGRITRREFFELGVIASAEEDTDSKPGMDKWEYYTKGVMTRLDLDLLGKGYPNRRLVYGPDGAMLRSEEDPDGDGKFVVVK